MGQAIGTAAALQLKRKGFTKKIKSGHFFKRNWKKHGAFLG